MQCPFAEVYLRLFLLFSDWYPYTQVISDEASGANFTIVQFAYMLGVRMAATSRQGAVARASLTALQLTPHSLLTPLLNGLYVINDISHKKQYHIYTTLPGSLSNSRFPGAVRRDAGCPIAKARRRNCTSCRGRGGSSSDQPIRLFDKQWILLQGHHRYF